MAADALAVVGLGSNMGDRRAWISRALAEIALLADTQVKQVSSLYETAPWGEVAQERFINAVALLATKRDPEGLLGDLLRIEDRLGRVRRNRWGPREIDLDLLLYNDLEWHSPTLTLPHPRIQDRAFVLVPLVEVAPDIRVAGTPARQLLAVLERHPGDVVIAGQASDSCAQF